MVLDTQIFAIQYSTFLILKFGKYVNIQKEMMAGYAQGNSLTLTINQVVNLMFDISGLI